jgi:oligosaccharide repeat unit polymerase
LAISLYLAIFLRFTDILNKKYFFQGGALFGLLVVLPFLDKFRHFNEENFTFSINLDFMSHGHFDAYQNFVRVVDMDIITYGNQLLGALLFFVPRSLFANKAIGSGAFTAAQANLSWNNISFPFLGEGYINFSVFGVVLFAFLLGYISGYMDKKYWSLKKHTNNHWFFGFYYLSFGLSFFLLRGDLMSSYAYGVTILSLYLVLVFMMVNILKIRYGGNKIVRI